MLEECVPALDNLRVGRKDAFVERICELGPECMREVCHALRVATSCDV